VAYPRKTSMAAAPFGGQMGAYQFSPPGAPAGSVSVPVFTLIPLRKTLIPEERDQIKKFLKPELQSLDEFPSKWLASFGV
jgi:hypothetical protein